MNLYSSRGRAMFVLFAPCVLTTSAVLLPWSLMGLLLAAPGLLGLAGIAGLLLGWIGLAAPGFAMRRRGLIVALLIAGLCAAALGVLAASGARSPGHGWDLSYLVGLGGSSLGYAAIAGVFLAGLARARPAGGHDARPGAWTWLLAIVVAISASIVPLVVLMFAAGVPAIRAMAG
jgi:hypothetical protein